MDDRIFDNRNGRTGYEMTDRELMIFRFASKNIKRSTGNLADILHMDRKDFEAAVKRGMDEEAEELEKIRRGKA